MIYGTGPATLEAAMKATTTIPIVSVCCNDAVREGWAQSAARPGRNVTGFTITYPELGAKRLQVLKEGVPGLSRLAVLVDPAEIPNFKDILKVMEEGARVLGVQLQILEVRAPNEFDRALRVARQGRAEGVLTFDTSKLFFDRARLAKLAVRTMSGHSSL